MRDFDSFIYVSRYLTIHDIFNCSLANKHFSHVFNQQPIWKELIARDFDRFGIFDYKKEYLKLFYIYHTTCNGQFRTNTLECPPHVVTNMLLHEWRDKNRLIQGLIVSFDEPVVCVHQLSTLEGNISDSSRRLHTFNRFGGGIWALAALEHILCLGSTDRNIHVVDLLTGHYLCVLTGHSGTIRCLSVNIIDLNWVLVSGSRDKSIKIWDLQRLVTENKSDDTSGSSTTPLRRSSRINTNPNTSPGNGLATDIDKYCLFTLNGHGDSVRSLSCTKDIIVSASYDRSARIWDYNGKLLHELIGHQDKVYAVACDGTHVWTGSLDNTIRVWSVTTGQCLYILEHHRSLVGIIDQSNRYVVSASADSSIGVYPRDFVALQLKMEHDKSTRKVYGMYSLHPFKALPINNVYLPHAMYRHTVQNAMFGNSFIHESVDRPTTFPILHHIEINMTAITCMAHNTHFLVVGCDGIVKLYNIQTGEFIRDLVTGITNVWRIKITSRHIIIAICRNQKSEILQLDFFVPNNFPIGLNTMFRTTSINNMDDSTDED
eukprot:NODE_335_length_10686_cov_0.203363.p2 type:complete len:545 gc:universal NODE_335_length_10686_cov_0.203363:6410-4776(-)